MKKMLSVWMLGLFLAFFSGSALGDSINHDAFHVLNRTVKVISRAQYAARTGQLYRGLSLTVTHQRRAQDLYGKGFYEEAIYHSLRARKLAIGVIDLNRIYLEKDLADLDEVEKIYEAKRPNDSSLDKKVKGKSVSNNDEAALDALIKPVAESTLPAQPAPQPQAAPDKTPAKAAAPATPVTPPAAATPAPAAGLKGMVAYVEGNMVVINLGANTGVQTGMVFVVDHVKAVVKDPANGEVIDQITVPIAELKVTAVKEKATTCVVTATLAPEFSIAVGDSVAQRPAAN
ncbi:flagellar assembly T-like protein [Hydrogenispora ethanolica]|uniref:Flagellar assembly T-like protein n=1 Tax=Hydrogenispora ethanolica TaxID=1082276 RepID=A0A4R1S260_HYDET|nr:FlgT C-terminal domain-containing protein [Hydrogenispora ethanolica]TCL72402.1 flagellar assembly T-like protein [Hydrogenispora ethanolica]